MSSSTCSSSPTKFENNNVIKNSIEKMNDSSRAYQPIKQSEISVKPSKKSPSTTSKRRNTAIHLNNLWSIWYGIFCSALQAYAAIKCLKRILGYSLLSWPEGLPYFELNCSLGLNGAAFLLLPIFLVVAILKVGNLANDGYKLGRQMSTCSKEPPEILTNTGGCGLFRYGGPTAPFIHIAISFCLLIPKLLMEAKLIEAGFLSQEWIWHTDLDFIVLHKDRLVILSFMPSNNTNNNLVGTAGVMATAAASLIQSKDTPLLRPTPLPFTSSSHVTNTVLKTLKDIVGHENHTFIEGNKSIESGWSNSVSIEYLNLALALVIYSVRYPALFWSTNKCLGIIFSFQLLINGLHTLLSFAGMSILYKVHVAGVWKSLPLLKHTTTRSIYSFSEENSPFLLNSQVTFALYILSTLLVLSSSIVLYFYGHTRFNAFLNQERERKVIMLKGEGSNIWSYFTHCAALCVLISIGVCNAPLLHDYTIIYKGSLDDITLICIISGILHLFFWIVIWLFLTIKQKWTFKLRITIGRATVREARSLKLMTDIHLNCNHRSEDLSQQPLLVVGNGRTYSVTETSPKKAIMGVIQKATLSKKSSKSNGSISNDDGEEQIYWLRPALAPSQNSPDGSKYFCWFKKAPKHKVTFNETTSTSVNRNKASVRRSLPGINEDDGDYATLRELPLPPSISQRLSNGDDTASEEGKLLACVHDEHVTYASNNQDLVPPAVYEDPSPLLTLEPAVIVHNFDTTQINAGPAPRCLRRTDSGIMPPHEELTARSDSLSTESSTSPPEPPGSHNSETSSGIHSNESTTDHIQTKVMSIGGRDWKQSQLDNTQTTITTNPTDALIENPEATVVIRRKSMRVTVAEVPASGILKEDPYGRATNMRMTSFTDNNDLNNLQSSSATLPHYPTQPPLPAVYPNCSTMPLPQHTTSSSNLPSTTMVNGNSCNVYPRQHTTIPTHHNGVKLITNSHNPYIKRLHTSTSKDTVVKYTNEPIYTKINRASGELYHYTS